MLDRAFFQRDPLTCARELIGCELVWGETAGVIVETEAYLVIGDEAAHTFFRPSARVFVENHTAGAAYVYFNYGMYWLFNVFVKGGSEDGFVLIRALEPKRGLETMAQRRGKPDGLCSGPGKLTIAMGIAGSDHGRDLCTDPAHTFHEPPAPVEVVTCRRVGISRAADFPWRFLQKDSPFVSWPSGKIKSQTARKGRSGFLKGGE